MSQEDQIRNIEKDYNVTLARLDRSQKDYQKVAPQKQSQLNVKDLEAQVALKDKRIKALS